MRSWQLSSILARRHQVDVFALRTPEQQEAKEAKEAREAKEATLPYASFEVFDIPSANPPKFSPQWAMLRLRSLRHPAAPFFRADAQRRLVRLAAEKKPDLIVWGMSWMLPYAAALPHIPGIVDEQNYDPLITARMAEGRTGVDAVKWKAYYEITARAERRNLRRVRGIAACSEQDAAIFRREAPHADVQVVPNGVDAEAFRAAGIGQRAAVIMTGSFNYAPNADGARRLALAVWPRVRDEVPDAELRLVGLHGERELADLRGLPGVTVVGTVPDIGPELAGARVAVAPITAGGGTRLKILEAMAAERPVVSTTIGAEGIAATDGRELMLRDGDAEFAAAVVQLLRDDALAERMGRAGRALVTRKYAWTASADALESLILRVARSPMPAAQC